MTRAPWWSRQATATSSVSPCRGGLPAFLLRHPAERPPDDRATRTPRAGYQIRTGDLQLWEQIEGLLILDGASQHGKLSVSRRLKVSRADGRRWEPSGSVTGRVTIYGRSEKHFKCACALRT